MIASSEQQRYLFYKKFLMPTEHGSVAAVAVSAEWGLKIQSLYTLMLRTIITEIWILCVLLIMSIVTRRRNVTHNMGVANVAIWNSQSSPASVAWSMLDYRMHIPWYAIMWALLAILAIAGQVFLPFYVAPRLTVNHAAPVNPNAVFVPGLPDPTNTTSVLINTVLKTPAYFRAINALEAVDPFTGNLDSTAMTTTHFDMGPITQLNGTLPFTRFNYSYEVSGVEFGFQHAPGLIHRAQGSCYTEYSWYQGRNTDNDRDEDIYLLPCPGNGIDCVGGYETINVSSSDSKTPNIEAILIKPALSDSPNATFALIVSSVGRLSPTTSEDPWYSTENTTSSSEFYRISNGRPALSCWQRDSWFYRGREVSTGNLVDLGVLPRVLINIINTFLIRPQIATLCANLGPSALKSATAGNLGSFLNAQTSSLESDMRRLVSAAYLATKNTFAETTVTNHSQFPDIPNAVINATTNRLFAGTGDFVVYGAGFAALSLSFLISIPLILILLFVVVYILGTNRWAHWPWGNLNAMNATILYTAIDSKNFKDDKELMWRRSSSSPYHPVDGQALVRPSYHRRDRSYGWSSVGSQDMYLLEESRYEPTST